MSPAIKAYSWSSLRSRHSRADSPHGLTSKTLLALASTDVSDFSEAVEDRIGTKAIAAGVSVSYNYTTGETTITNSDPGSGARVTNEHIQDVVGAMLADRDFDFTYDDAGNTETNIVRKASKNFALPRRYFTLTNNSGSERLQSYRTQHGFNLTPQF